MLQIPLLVLKLKLLSEERHLGLKALANVNNPKSTLQNKENSLGLS